jgi:TolB protein
VHAVRAAGRRDGQRIAFNAGSPTLSDIYLINSDGSGLNKITSDAHANFYPTWSPDGSRIGFATARSGSREVLTVNPETVNAGGSWKVYTVLVETGATRSLIDGPGFDGQPAWQPTPR